MARIDGVINNFLHHVTGGLSGFITGAYDASERAKQQVLLVKLLPKVELEAGFAGDEDLLKRAHGLRDKFLEMAAASKASVDELALMVEVDFAWDPESAERRRQELAAVPVYYGYDPVYRCTVAIRLGSGEERSRSMRIS